MSVSGPCEICNSADVQHTCNRCAKLVCERHYDADSGYCVDCAAELGVNSEDSPIPDEEDMPDGVDTYEF